MKLDYILVLAAFYALAAWTFLYPPMRTKALRRSMAEWTLDITGLCIHGMIVPAFQTFVIFASLRYLFPAFAGTLHISSALGFLLSFVGVDYLYYWNHRLLHQPLFWRWHSVHHSSETMDVFATSRNSAITSFLIVYVWINGLMLFFLDHKEGYIIGVALTNFLDILRHSGIPRWPNFFPFRFITSPKDHAWHHSTDTYDINFSGNLIIWDHLHRSRHLAKDFPKSCGYTMKPKSLLQVFWQGYFS